MMYSIGSLFSGYGGLDMGVQLALGPASIRWVCDVEAGPTKILARHYPGAPNLGDVTRVDWTQVETVDVVCGGSPCQDLSMAGRRAGMKPGTRSGLWESMFNAVKTIRPRLVVWENVLGALSAPAFSIMEPDEGCVGNRPNEPVLRALGRVLGDLASIGYDAQWTSLRASDIGACHQRARIFVVAYPQGDLWWLDQRKHCEAISHTDFAVGAERGEPTAGEATSGRARADAGRSDRAHLGLFPTPTAERVDGRKSAAFADGRANFYDLIKRRRFGEYADAVARHAAVFGRPAPSPTESGKTGERLSPAFVEWMMGLPAGHVTAEMIGLTRTQQLRALGNGVVPQQAAAAICLMADRQKTIDWGAAA